MGISDFTSKVIGDKRRWRQYKARTRALPENYRTAVEGIDDPTGPGAACAGS